MGGYEDIDPLIGQNNDQSEGRSRGHLLTIVLTILGLTGLVSCIFITLKEENISSHEYEIHQPSLIKLQQSTFGRLPPPDTPDPKVDPGPSDSLLGKFEYGAVSVDSIPCATIGKKVMLDGGNVFDSSIATMYCNSVVNSQSMGLGGGFIMTIYLTNGTKLALIARETAPAAADKDMFHGNSDLTHFGPLASGVPGFVAGTWELKQRLGNPQITWERLLQPTVDMCFEGITLNNHAYHMLHQEEGHVRADPGLSSVFVNPITNTIWQEGDIYTYQSLGETIRRIAKHGAKEFYEGETGQKLVADVQAAGGIITMEDLKNYRVKWETPVTHQLKNLGYTLISSPPPGSGAIMTSILGVMDAYQPSPLDRHRPLAWHRFIEACKFGFAKRTEMGDWLYKPISEQVSEIIQNLTSQEWVEHIKSKIDDQRTYQDPRHYGADHVLTEDHGTCHHSLIAPNGDAVSVTASVNLIWGCKFMSPQTGIIMNNQMDDFASPNITSAYEVPPSPNNFIAPGKRPMSSMSTTIVVDNQGRVIAVAGASGGTKIISATAQVLFRMFYLGQNVKQAIDARRFHHQLFPMNLDYEDGITTWLVKELEAFGHNMTNSKFRVGGAAVQAIFVDPNTGTIEANADFRKRGTVDGF